MNNISAPYIRTKETGNERTKDWAIAILPVLIWSVFMFGARVITLSVIGSSVALGLDYITRRFVFKIQKGARIDGMAAVYGILAVFTMPVIVPLFTPALSAVLVVIAKNIRVIKGKRLFNPFIFSAAVLNLFFPSMMTAFTKPFAYFSAFDITIDPALAAGYRVTSPLQYMADGSVYEDGIWAQLYGFASGNMGEIAVAAMIISLVWLVIRKEGSFYGTIGMLFPMLLLSLIFPSGDAESSYYAYSILLSGGVVFISVFAMNESHTVPLTDLGRVIIGALCGIIIFITRKFASGAEWGYLTVLLLNVISPFIEQLTRPRDRKNKRSPILGNPEREASPEAEQEITEEPAREEQDEQENIAETEELNHEE